VEYAKERYIEIIPDIELPGHSLAAIASYPELSCTEEKKEVGVNWGIYKDIYCPGKEGTFKFLEEVLAEIMEIFSSNYIHLGGDEAPKDRWEKCPHCQRRMKAENISDEEHLQLYFTQRIRDFLKTYQKQSIV